MPLSADRALIAKKSARPRNACVWGRTALLRVRRDAGSYMWSAGHFVPKKLNFRMRVI